LTEYTPVPQAMQAAEISSHCDDPKEVLTRVCLMSGDEVESNNEAARLATRRLVAMNVTELRVTRRLSQVELARRAGITEREVEDVEAGVGEMLIDTLSSLADGLNVDVTFLFRKRADDVH
jgi:DNA-binding transcriptional regulator YiaG